jgi:hypothetical protein
MMAFVQGRPGFDDPKWRDSAAAQAVKDKKAEV